MSGRQIEYAAELAAAVSPLAGIDSGIFAALCENFSQHLVAQVYADDDLRSIIESFSSAHPGAIPSAESLAGAVLETHAIFVSSDDEPNDVVDQLVANFRLDEKSEPDQAEALRTNINLLLGVAPLRRAALAADLLNDRDNLYLECRVFSDLRPIKAGKHAVATFDGSVITHSLKLVYRGADGVTSAFFSMDTEDLLDLANVVSRAIGEARALGDGLAGSPLKPILLSSEE